MQNVAGKRISIIGCGWLGLPLAKYLLDLKYPIVKGSTTSPEKLDTLRSTGIDGQVVSLNPEPQGEQWSELLEVDSLIVDIPPRSSKQGEEFHPRQIGYLTEMVKNSPISEIVYISSTSVYKELNRKVYEQDVVQANQSAVPFLVEAEQLMMALREKDRRVAVLRCGGLMGYDRIPGKYVRGKQNINTGHIPVNYIHRDDVVAMLAELVTGGVPDETFNCVAPLHPERREVYEASCRQFGWEAPTFAAPNPTATFKVVSSDKLAGFLNYTFLYPDPLHFYYSLDMISQ